VSSTTIDQKVVEMRFDNKQFESNVQTSLTTLDKLKQSLKLENASQGLENIDSASRGINFSGLSSAVETVKSKFTAFEVVAITALMNITNSAVDAGKKLVSSLSIEQVTAGWQKYADKTSAVQTIMAATAKDFTNTGEQMEYVNSQLNKLNWFTDETSYSFLDMVSNIGKFTSNGVKLDTAVTAMQGISSWAAISGANVQEASRAMYNLSQALATGSVKLIDWKSIENANMATSEFKQTVIDTAVSVGTLTSKGNGLYETLEGHEVSVSNFNENLKDAWFSSEVLLKSLNKYGGFSDKLYEVSEKTNLTATELLEAISDYQNGTLDISKISDKTGVSVTELTSLFDELSSDTMKLGEKSFKAAQEAKTFQEALDSVKDAVSTGWMNTFELIFGNYEEAKKLWTNVANELYDVFASSSEARNEMLGEWKDMGGREAMLEAVTNAWEGLKSVLDTVKEAFREVFPPMTAEQLMKITESIRDLSAKFVSSDKTAKNLKNTFKGLFAVFDIVKQAVSALFGGLKLLIGFLPGVGDGILGVTGSFGEWIFKMDETLKKNDTFKKAVESVVSFIQSIPEKINRVFQELTGISIGDAFDTLKAKASDLLDKLKEVFSGFGDVDTSGIDSLTNRVRDRFEPLGAVFDGVKKLFSGIWHFFKKLSPIFSTLATHIGNALGKLGDVISDSLDGANFKNVFDLVNGGIFAAIGIGIKKFVDSLSDVTGSASGFIGSLKGIFDDVRVCLESWQQNLKAGILMKIAGAVAILAASLIALSLVDSDKLTVALTAITMLFIDLFGSMAAFEKIMGNSELKSINKVSSAMIKMAAAVMILSLAMKTLASVDQDSLNNALVAVTVLMADLVAASIALSKWGDKIKTSSVGMVLFAEAINILAGAVKKLGELDYDVLEKGLLAVGAVMAELSAFMIGAKFGEFKAGQGLAIIELAAALLFLQKAVSAFASMDPVGMIQGLGGVGAVLAEIAGFMKLIGDSKKMIATATGVTILGAAMLIFSNAVKSFAEMNWEELAKGLLGMGVSLAAVAVAMNNMPTTTPIIAAGMILVGEALKIIAGSMNDFSGMSWEGIAKSIIALAGSLGIIAVALKMMKKSLSGAAALLVVAGALAVLTPSLKSFGKMSLAEIGKSLLVLAGAFTVIGVAGLLLKPIVPAILGLSAAIALLGVGTLACGAGLLAFSAGLTALSASGTAAIAFLVLAIEALISLIPEIAIQAAKGTVEFIAALGEMAPVIMEAVAKIICSTLQMIRDTVPDLVETVIYLLEQVLISLDNHLPTILGSVMSMLITILAAIRDNIGEIVTIVIDTIVATLEAIANKLPDIIQAGIDIVVSLIDGLAKGIEDNAERIREAFINLFKSLLKAVLTFLGIDSSQSEVFLNIGINTIQGLINGIGQMLGDLLSKIGEVLSSMIKAIKDKLGEFLQKGKELMTNIKDGIANKLSEVKSKVTEVITTCVTVIKNKVSEFKTKGQELMTNLKTGISDKLSAIKEAAKNVISNALNAIKEKVGEWTDIGKNLIEGLANGILNAASGVVSAAKGVVDNIVGGVEKLLKISSPSKVFAEIGMYCDKGLIQGLEKSANEVSKASEYVGKQAIKGLSKSIDGMSDTIDFDIDADPTIKPVLDLTDVSNGVKDLNKMLYTQKTIDLAGNVNFAMNSASERNLSEKAKVYNDSGVIKEIGRLREDIGSLAGAIAQMKLVMDTGTLVGALSGPMDSALGMRAKYGQRGN
jgi:tape measure domain-containing protein